MYRTVDLPKDVRTDVSVCASRVIGTVDTEQYGMVGRMEWSGVEWSAHIDPALGRLIYWS